MNKKAIIFSLMLCSVCGMAFAQKPAPKKPHIKLENGKMEYDTYRYVDYSFCGYRQSDANIPDVPVKAVVNDAEAIQTAIDYVGKLPADKNGHRGAVLLGEGTFEISQRLHIANSGVVLRGMGRDKTIIRKKGVDRMSLLLIEGKGDVKYTDSTTVAQDFVYVNDKTIRLANATNYKVGDRISLTWQSTNEWINSLGCAGFSPTNSTLGWHKGDTDVQWTRRVTAVKGNEITIDVPLTMTLNKSLANTIVARMSVYNIIGECGVENLTLESDYESDLDENHCWTGISVDNAENCWVRMVNFRHFAGSAVILQRGASMTTVEDCKSYEPKSEVAGARRQTFYTLGQMNLFQRCYSEEGIHDFSAGWCAAGPNAFVQCEAMNAHGYSGPVEAWACGLLFDIVDIIGNDIKFCNLGQSKNGAGWNTANSMLWQCTAGEIFCYSPDADNTNHCYYNWSKESGDGDWYGGGNFGKPRSLFAQQLEDRTSAKNAEKCRIYMRNTNASSNPAVEDAQILAEEARTVPRVTLEAWIDSAVFNSDLLAQGKAKVISAPTKKSEATHHNIAIANGQITKDGSAIAGNLYSTPWWRGNIRPSFVKGFYSAPAVTRFVPDREGTGLTDRIDSVVNYMDKNNFCIFAQNYGLWTDRRRDDHLRVKRRDADVWAPFYEQPLARSGKETAWDGMTKYDLTKPNKWYFARLNEFADKFNGLLYFHHYFQHNILEAGAHWVDSPWRPVNNINGSVFPEPVPFTGDKRIFVATFFYDINNPKMAELHRQYIRQQLDQFKGKENVVHLISEEFTGPLHFVQFWIDCIKEWEAENGRVKVALSVTKDVQDAILSDPSRASVVDIIDIKYWHYNTKGLWAIESGKNLSPRQWQRKFKPGSTGFNEVFKAVSEYKQKYPEKAVTYSAQNFDKNGWAVLMAGGSCANIKVDDAFRKKFLASVASMKPEVANDDIKVMKGDNAALVYLSSATEKVSLPAGKFTLYQIDSTGKVKKISGNIKGEYAFGEKAEKGVYWFTK